MVAAYRTQVAMIHLGELLIVDGVRPSLAMAGFGRRWIRCLG
jgi:hypothetical protein